MLKIEKFTDVCMTGGMSISPVIQTSVNFSNFNIHVLCSEGALSSAGRRF